MFFSVNDLYLKYINLFGQQVIYMNEKFFQLSEEKQLRIVNAAMEVFSQNDYKRASTDVMAEKAGISKGLLFHYFHNKQELYLYVMDYAQKIMTAQVTGQSFYEIDDFFELLEYSAKQKYSMLAKNPYILDFSVRSFFPKARMFLKSLMKSLPRLLPMSMHNISKILIFPVFVRA